MSDRFQVVLNTPPTKQTSSSSSSSSPKCRVYLLLNVLVGCCKPAEGLKTNLEESVEARFLPLTPDDGLLAHFKKVDKRWVGLHQLFRLGRFQRKSEAAGSTFLTGKHFFSHSWNWFYAARRVNEWRPSNHICVAPSVSLSLHSINKWLQILFPS